MNPQRVSETANEAASELALFSTGAASEEELPSGWAWTPEEQAALLRLRHWYQNGGSDRASVARHLEFLNWKQRVS
jgi:hypothetical protein